MEINSIYYGTYPFAFFTPGGGEIQLRKYAENLKSLNIKLFNQWDPGVRAGDIFHYFSCMSGSEHFLNYLKNMGVTIIVSPNLWIEEDEKSKYPIKEIKIIFDIAHIIVCNSQGEKNKIIDVFGVNKEKLKIVKNAVDVRFLIDGDPYFFRKKYGIYEKFILNVANIEPRKNQLALIRVMKNFPEYKLVIIGGIRDKEYYLECQSESDGQLIYIERVDHSSNELLSAYKACEIFALPSLVETPGLAALEAAATGAKIIITERGCAKEYFGDYVYYANPAFDLSMKNAIERALGDKGFNSDHLINHIKKNYLWENAVRDLQNIYTKTFDLTPQVAGVGFYDIEYDENNIPFHWGAVNARFKNINRNILFEIRVLNSAKVLIKSFSSGRIIQSVDADGKWKKIELKIADEVMDDIVFNVDPSAVTTVVGDQRELAIAVRNIEIQEG
jgi:glycosyltransferase involved in cell wall biosynthesis